MTNIKRNFSYNMIYQMLLIILPLFTAPYISRVLGADALGRYSYAFSMANYFLLFSMLGIANFGNRQIAMVKNDKNQLDIEFSKIYQIQFLLCLICLVIYGIYIFFFAPDLKMALVLVVYLLSAMFDISWLFFGLEEFKLTVVRNTMIKIFTTICIFVFVKQVQDIYIYCLILSFGTLSSQVYLWFFLRKRIRLRLSTPIVNMNYLKEICVLFIPILSYSIYKIMDKLMIGSMSTYSQLGFYTNSEKIISIPIGIITALGTVMLPRISNMMANGEKNGINSYFKLSIKFVTFIACAVSFGLIGISDILSPVYFGSEFSECGNIISCLSVSVFFVAWANVVRTQYLIPNKRNKIYVVSTIVGAVANLVANIILIPKLNALGASLGTVLAEALVMITQAVLIRKEINVLKLISTEYAQFIIGFVMMISVSYLGRVMGISVKTLMVQVALGGTLYVMLLLFYMVISKDPTLKLIRGRK